MKKFLLGMIMLTTIFLVACFGSEDEKPLTFYGTQRLNHPLGETFDPLEGVYALDSEGNDLREDIRVDGNVDTDSLGMYHLTYTVKDTNGNEKTVDREIEIIESAEGTYDFSTKPSSIRNQFISEAERYLMRTLKGGIPIFTIWRDYHMVGEDFTLPIDEPLPVIGYGYQFGSLNGRTLRIGKLNDFETYNLWEMSDLEAEEYGAWHADTLYYRGIDEANETMALFEGLAETPPTPVDENEQGKATTFHIRLRDDLTWTYHARVDTDNLPEGHEIIDAGIYEETFRRALEHGWQGAEETLVSSDYPIENAREYLNGDVDSWANVGIQALDNHTLELVFEKPMNAWQVQYFLSSPGLVPIHPELDEQARLEGKTYGDSLERTAFSGPYVIDIHEENLILRMNQNSDFHDPDRHSFGRIFINIFETDYERNVAFESGQIDIVSPRYIYLEIIADERLAPFLPDRSYNININGINNSAQSESNRSGEPILAYDAFKKAIYHAIDFATMDFGHTVPNHRMVPEHYVFSPWESMTPLQQTPESKSVFDNHSTTPDADKAESYWKEALNKAVSDGHYNAGDTIEITLQIAEYPFYDELGDAIKTALETHFISETHDIALTVVVDELTYSELRDNVRNKDFDLSIDGVVVNLFEPLELMDAFRSDISFIATENPGSDTSKPEILLEYDHDGETVRELWSYSALISALQGPTKIEQGRIAE